MRGGVNQTDLRESTASIPSFPKPLYAAKRLDARLRVGHERLMVTGGLESVGEAVTGGLAARAVEPAAGEGGGATDGACLNCGTDLIGPHCHRCGQAAHVHRTVTAWWHDLAHGVLHLDGKIWRTLPLLAWRPGELTRRYVNGERAKFVSPLALFLFTVFLMFAVLSALGPAIDGMDEARKKDLAAEAAKADATIARLETERRGLAARRADMSGVDARLREARAERQGVALARRGVGERGPLVDTDIDTGWPRLDRGIRKANDNPQLLLYKLQTNAYKFSWALIPISVPFLWLLFLHRRRYRSQYKAYDHLVFVTYSIAFISLALITFFLLGAVGLGGGLLGAALLVVPPVHLYRQLRGAYALSRFSALWRTLLLLVFANIALALFLLLLVALGVLA
jgi:uncharacterized protein DUF3667